jgi:hypothetical protein
VGAAAEAILRCGGQAQGGDVLAPRINFVFSFQLILKSTTVRVCASFIRIFQSSGEAAV